jgi:surface polysaccharide O-acyltransferase-like enzyme
VNALWKFGVVALIALALTVLPGGGAALGVALTLLSVVFFTAIAVLGYRLYRQFNFELSTLDRPLTLILYGSLGLALLTFTATSRLLDQGGAGLMVWIALLALASYGFYFVWTRYRSYE